ncbi:hypothetical protein BaRGS_00031447 [Batillaria attramentaria]|uniref:Uncharacterized protein n=1 Tax=Batillaria attramentaria TaxID=370345 RepID=A0ABD0JQJ5_9CAEN
MNGDSYVESRNWVSRRLYTLLSSTLYWAIVGHRLLCCFFSADGYVVSPPPPTSPPSFYWWLLFGAPSASPPQAPRASLSLPTLAYNNCVV